MDLALSDDQQLLVNSFAGLLDKQSSPADVRAAEPLGFDPNLWRTLRELGPVEMAVSEDDGGWGATMVDLCLVGDCLGRHCAAAPVIETQVAARLFARLEGESLDEVLAGGIATLALHPPVADAARLVPAGAVAGVVLVRSGDAILAVRNDSSQSLVPNHGGLPLADVPLGRAEPVAAGVHAVAAYETAVDEWLLLTGSALVGLSSSALTLAVEYAKERRAFGSPIGAFQGIAHRLADVATDIEGARLLVQEAAWSTDTGLSEAAERACGAFAFAADIARKATYWAVHTLGGYGVMLEYDAQLYFRRARGWGGVFGDAEAAYRRVARHRYGRREA
jgi:alkylation response protein AidB-like acyl-CoA dehydrogenase